MPKEDSASVEQYVASLTGEVFDANVPSLQDFHTEAQSGNASIKHDFDVSPTMGPRLGISYSSLRGGSEVRDPEDRIGPVGIGWDLVGLSWLARDKIVINGSIHGKDRWTNRAITYTRPAADKYYTHARIAEDDGTVSSFGPEEGFRYCTNYRNACLAAHPNKPGQALLCQYYLINLMNPYVQYDFKDENVITRRSMIVSREDVWGNRIRYFYIADPSARSRSGILKAKELRLKKIVWGGSAALHDAVTTKQIELSQWAAGTCSNPPTTDPNVLAARLNEVDIVLNSHHHIAMNYFYEGFSGNLAGAEAKTDGRLSRVELRKIVAGHNCIENCGDKIRAWMLAHSLGSVSGDKRLYLTSIAEYRDNESDTKPAMSFNYYPYSRVRGERGRASLLRHVYNGYQGQIDFSYDNEDYASGILNFKSVQDHTTGKIVEHNYQRWLRTETSYPDNQYMGARLVREIIKRSPESGEVATSTCTQSGRPCVPHRCIERRFITNDYSERRSHGYNYMDGAEFMDVRHNSIWKALKGEMYQETEHKPRSDGFCGASWFGFEKDTWPHGRYRDLRRYFEVDTSSSPPKVKVTKEIARNSMFPLEISADQWNTIVPAQEKNYTYDTHLNITVESVNAHGAEQKRTETSYHAPFANRFGDIVLRSRLAGSTRWARDPHLAALAVTGRKALNYALNARGEQTNAVNIESLQVGPNQACNEQNKDQTTRWTYTANGMPRSKVVGSDGTLQIQESWSYETAFWFLKTQERKGPLKTDFAYDANLSVHTISGPYKNYAHNALKIRNHYDKKGWLRLIESSSGVSESKEYGFSAGRRFFVRSCKFPQNSDKSNQKRCQYQEFDAWGKVGLHQEANGAFVETQYDLLGREVSRTVPRFVNEPAVFTRTEYNVQDASTITRHANGLYTHVCDGRLGDSQTRWDIRETRYGEGRPISCGQAATNSRRSRAFYNIFGDIRMVEELPLGVNNGEVFTRYYHDASGRLMSVSDALREQQIRQGMNPPARSAHIFNYDWLGRVIHQSDADRGASYTCYHASGPVKAVNTAASRATSPQHPWIHYDYDSAGRMIKESRSDGSTINTWDGDSEYGAGKIVSTKNTQSSTNAQFSSTTLGVSTKRQTYDSRGRLSQEMVDGRTVAFAYNDFNDVACEHYVNSGRSLRFGYNGAGQLHNINLTQCACGEALGPTCRYETILRDVRYSSAGKPNLISFGDGSSQNRQYLPNGRINFIEIKDRSRASRRKMHYKFDDVKDLGDISTIEDTVTGDIRHFDYDYAGRLKIAELSSPQSGVQQVQNYSYDLLGNVLSSGDGRQKHNYDQTGRLLWAHRDLNTGQYFSYVHGTGQVRRKEVRDLGVATVKDGYELHWDSLGRTTRVTQLPEQSSVFRIFGSDGVARLVNQSGSVLSSFGPGRYELEGTTHRMKLDVAGAASLIIEGSGSTIRLAKVLHKDMLGSVSYITSKDSVTGGDMPLYHPFGKALGTDFAASNVEGFTGQRKKEYGDLYDYGARMYDPEGIYRFVSPDPLVPNRWNPQDWNAYAYVRNNPIRYNDPTGMFPESPHTTILMEQGDGGRSARDIFFDTYKPAQSAVDGDTFMVGLVGSVLIDPILNIGEFLTGADLTHLKSHSHAKTLAESTGNTFNEGAYIAGSVTGAVVCTVACGGAAMTTLGNIDTAVSVGQGMKDIYQNGLNWQNGTNLGLIGAQQFVDGGGLPLDAAMISNGVFQGAELLHEKYYGGN